MKLYEITGALKSLSSETDVDDQALSDTLESIEHDFNEKANNILALTNNWNSDLLAVDEEIKRLSNKKKVITGSIGRLKEYLRHNMERSGIKKIESPIFSASIKMGRDIVNIIDESKLPDDYVSVKTSITPDKRALLKALKEGVDIPGAELTKSKSSILIK